MWIRQFPASLAPSLARSLVTPLDGAKRVIRY